MYFGWNVNWVKRYFGWNIILGETLLGETFWVKRDWVKHYWANCYHTIINLLNNKVIFEIYRKIYSYLFNCTNITQSNLTYEVWNVKFWFCFRNKSFMFIFHFGPNVSLGQCQKQTEWFTPTKKNCEIFTVKIAYFFVPKAG